MQGVRSCRSSWDTRIGTPRRISDARWPARWPRRNRSLRIRPTTPRCCWSRAATSRTISTRERRRRWMRWCSEHVRALDPDGLMDALEREPQHACGGGPMVAVLRAARALGATRARVLCYRDSGDVSGDKSSVVRYGRGGLVRILACSWTPNVKAASSGAALARSAGSWPACSGIERGGVFDDLFGAFVAIHRPRRAARLPWPNRRRRAARRSRAAPGAGRQPLRPRFQPVLPRRRLSGLEIEISFSRPSAR